MGVGDLPKMGTFTKRVQLNVTDDLYRALKAEATREGLPIAQLIRRMLEAGLAERAAAKGQDAVTRALRQAIKPTEDRLAALVAKATHAAATAMYLNVQAMAAVGGVDNAIEL
ncbi:MAG: ribbon-helix-helix protein, CopG family, partial [Clostridia bacterium]|nr:ribbon-helix-helix protein, CopG family [Clostridia bacterium]